MVSSGLHHPHRSDFHPCGPVCNPRTSSPAGAHFPSSASACPSPHSPPPSSVLPLRCHPLHCCPLAAPPPAGIRLTAPRAGANPACGTSEHSGSLLCSNWCRPQAEEAPECPPPPPRAPAPGLPGPHLGSLVLVLLPVLWAQHFSLLLYSDRPVHSSAQLTGATAGTTVAALCLHCGGKRHLPTTPVLPVPPKTRHPAKKVCNLRSK